MSEEIKRPEGAREGDFGKLNDWTVTDIANAPSTAREDKANAEAEIARRKEAGTYDVENAPHETKKDFLGHGYGIDRNGKVLYPSQEYQDWLESGRKGERPRGEVRESIDDRLEAEREAIEEEIASEEQTQARDRSVGEAALKNFGEESGRVLIRRPSEDLGEDADTKAELRAKKKAADIRLKARREMKDATKYGNQYYNPEKMEIAEMRENIPLLEDIESFSEGYVENHNRGKKPSEKRLEKAFEKASERFRRGFIGYYRDGAIKELSSGSFNINPKAFITESFLESEKSQVDGILASKRERGRFWESFRDNVIEEKISEWNTLPNVEKAEHDAILTAIKLGATLKQTGFDRSEIQSILPIKEHGEGRLQNFMKMYDVDPDSKEAQKSSYTGFANIIERIVEQESRDKFKYHDGKATEEGFKILDWYYETFNYGDSRNTQGFLNTMEGYKAIAGSEWKQKYAEYMEKHRKQDLEEIEKRDEQEPLPTLEESKELDGDELIKRWEELAEGPGIDDADAWQKVLTKLGVAPLEIFKDKEKWPKQYGNGGVSNNNAPMPLDKLNAFMKNFVDIKQQHPDARANFAILNDRFQGKIPHLVAHYSQGNSSVAILEPIKPACYSACYVWVTDDPQYTHDDWDKIFSYDSTNPNAIISKYDRAQRDDVKRFYHRAAPKKQLSAEDNLWRNVRTYIDKIA